jgi:uncharacterized protein YndB with AHSA1/START domain
MTMIIDARSDDFTAELQLPASPPAVLALFTSAEGISRWWGPTTGNADVGGTLRISFGEHGENAVRVKEAGPSRVVWEPIVPDNGTPTGHTLEWLGTSIEIDILPSDSGSELHFRHSGLTPQLECWEACDSAWTYFLSSVEALVKTGIGTPFPA